MHASPEAAPPRGSRPRRGLCAVLTACLLSAGSVGCASESSGEPELEESKDAILGGRVEPGWPAVGLLQFRSGNFGSGALISPTMVLTAAHVALGNPTQFFYGSPAAGKAPTTANLLSAPVAEIIVHPCYNTPKAAGCPGEAIDVALVRLAQPITGVAPLEVIDAPLESWFGLSSPYEGDSCVAVGFGGHRAADGKVTTGTRRSAMSTVKSVDATELVTVRGTGIATGGDSGGPLLCGDKIIGTVRGNAGAASKTDPWERIEEGYERIDLWRDWIASGGKKR
jgi:hypothetical protein